MICSDPSRCAIYVITGARHFLVPSVPALEYSPWYHSHHPGQVLPDQSSHQLSSGHRHSHDLQPPTSSGRTFFEIFVRTFRKYFAQLLFDWENKSIVGSKGTERVPDKEPGLNNAEDTEIGQDEKVLTVSPDMLRDRGQIALHAINVEQLSDLHYSAPRIALESRAKSKFALPSDARITFWEQERLYQELAQGKKGDFLNVAEACLIVSRDSNGHPVHRQVCSDPDKYLCMLLSGRG